MNKQRLRIVAGIGCALVAVIVVLVVLAQKRPASCDAAMRSKAGELHKTGLAIASVTKAEALVDAALTKADLVDTHFFLFRRYDPKVCDDAQAALARATGAVAEATKNKAALSVVFAGREAVLHAAAQALASATSWIATGLADELVDERRAAKERVDAARAQLDRVSGEAKASGYENVDDARAGADASALQVDGLTEKATATVLRKCHRADLGFATARTVDDWLVVVGPHAAAIATIESDPTVPNAPKRCTPLDPALSSAARRVGTACRSRWSPYH